MCPLQHSRRHLLRTGGAVLAATLAGCPAESDQEDDQPPREPGEHPDGAITDLEWVSVRHDATEPLIDPDGSDEDPELDDHALLVETSDRETLTFLAEPPGVERAREFLRGIDFESESVLVVQGRIGACFDRHVNYVLPESNGFDADTCRVLRDADVRCRAGDRDVLVTFVRVPVAYDRRPSNFGYGSSSDCGGRYRPASGTPTAAPTDGGADG